MTKDKIIELLVSSSTEKMPEFAIAKISENLKDGIEYEMSIEGNSIKINTVLKDGERGSYDELICEFEKESNNVSIVVNRKEYSPTYEVRHGFRQEVGMDLFTKSKSYVYGPDGMLMYKSSFTDDNKYFGGRGRELEYTKEALSGYFTETTPTYDKGVVVDSASSAYQPFTFEWQRYGKTHVVKTHSRNPMNGESGAIAITFDDESKDDEELLQESYGQIYLPGREIKLGSPEEIIEKIDQLYEEAKTGEEFDMEGFRQSFDSAMFEPRQM